VIIHALRQGIKGMESMDELVIYLEENTKPDDFTAWLDAYFSKRHSEEYPYQPGVKVVMIYYALEAKQAKIGATADRTNLKKIDDDKEILEFDNVLQIDNAIVVSWLKVGNRLKVTLKHYGATWVIPPVFNLLTELGKDWKQARGDIWKIIQEQAQKYHIQIRECPFDLFTDQSGRLEMEQIYQFARSGAGTITDWKDAQGRIIQGGTIMPGHHVEMLNGFPVIVSDDSGFPENMRDGHQNKVTFDQAETTKPQPPDLTMPIDAMKMEQPRQNNRPRIPKRGKELQDWRLRWSIISDKWQKGHFETYQACIGFLEKYHKRLACKEDVLADTIAAGMAGLLDFLETS